MKKQLVTICAVVMMVLAVSGIAQAGVTITKIRIAIAPSDVPDEDQPRINVGDAPGDYGPDSWQNTAKVTAAAKVNWHARYLGDGDYLSALFPDNDVAAMTIADLDHISYWTKRPDGTDAGEDWAIKIYTRPLPDQTGWYNLRFTNNYSTHAETDAWTQYSTSSGMTFSLDGGDGTQYTLAELGTTYGAELIEMISVQTWTNYEDFDGYMDGLEIGASGNIGQVDFVGPVPEPLTMATAFFAVGGLGAYIRRRTGRAAA